MPTIAVRTDGSIVCMTCGVLVTFDQQLREIDRIDARDFREMAVGPDNSVYAYVHQRPVDGRSIAAFDLVALEPTGEPRWRTPIESDLAARLVGGAEGPYLEQLAGPDEAFRPTVTAFDAVEGWVNWTRPHHLLGAGRTGVFTAQDAPNAVTLRHLGPRATVFWERRVTSPSALLRVTDVAVTPTGGGVFVGRSEASVDLGDRKIEGPPGRPLAFVVEIDAGGATRWALTTPGIFADHVALADNGEILLAGHLDFRDDDNRADAFVAVATPEGLVRTHRIGGASFQSVDDLASSTDGLAWLQVSSHGGEDEPDPVLRIGEHEFRETGSYLFAIVP